MKTIKYLLFLGLLGLFACEEKIIQAGDKIKINDSTEVIIPPVPEKLIPKELMVSLLVQMQIAEVIATNEALPQGKGLGRYKKYEGYILAQYKLDTTVFRQNYEYYLGDVRRAEWIYSAMMDSLLIRKSKKNL